MRWIIRRDSFRRSEIQRRTQVLLRTRLNSERMALSDSNRFEEEKHEQAVNVDSHPGDGSEPGNGAGRRIDGSENPERPEKLEGRTEPAARAARCSEE